jgi:hypothetical protein
MKIEIPPYCCNICKKRRDSDFNHWFIVSITPADSSGPARLQMWQWVDKAADFGDGHACGQDHLQVLVARWMDHGTLEEADKK